MRIVERVRYVSALGEVLEARTLGRPDERGEVRLLVSYGGLARLRIVTARHSEAREPGTWHGLALPN